MDFNSHAPCGARHRKQTPSSGIIHFNSHAPCGARPTRLRQKPRSSQFQLTRPMRGATSVAPALSVFSVISTHTPHAGRDNSARMGAIVLSTFQLTRPMRGATATLHAALTRAVISTHTPHAGRDTIRFEGGENAEISTHTPHAGRDLDALVKTEYENISTHTPHAGRDRDASRGPDAGCDFNSHAPCGARRQLCAMCRLYSVFQLTRPMRGATCGRWNADQGFTFQLTRPMRGATFFIAITLWR